MKRKVYVVRQFNRGRPQLDQRRHIPLRDGFSVVRLGGGGGLLLQEIAGHYWAQQDGAGLSVWRAQVGLQHATACGAVWELYKVIM